MISSRSGGAFSPSKVRSYQRSDALAGREVGGVTVTVTTQDFWKMLLEAEFRCTLCGVTMDVAGDTGVTLDRICNDSGHQKSNCRVCCWNCNRAKK